MSAARTFAAVALLACVPLASAGDAALESAFWDVHCTADGAAARPRLGGDAQVLAGATKDGVAVEVTALEADAERDAAAWTSELLATWKTQGRAAAASASPDPDGVLVFSESGLGGAARRHAYRLRVRGVHAFVLHAVGRPGDDAALRGALAAFVVGDRRGASLGALAAARVSGGSPSDPRMALRAIGFYLPEKNPRPAIAAEIATWNVLASPGATFSAEETWAVCERIGLCFLTGRRVPDAVDWLEKARSRCATTSEAKQALASTVYNIACAHAVSGAKDAAFAAIDELVKSGGWAEFSEWAQEDPDLETLRSDERWGKLPK